MELYQKTPYLQQLLSQLGQGFAQVVAKEVRNFDKVRAHHKENENQKALQKLPTKLKSVGAILAGPLSLPRGDTTQLPILLRDQDGRLWRTGVFVVNADHSGQWELVGVRGSGGEIAPASQPKEYEPDDLSQANGSIDSTLDKIGSVSRAFIKHAQSDPIGNQPQGGALAVGQQQMGGGGLQTGLQGGLANIGGNAQQNGGQSQSSSRGSVGRRIPGSQNVASNDTVSGPQKQLGPEDVGKRLRKRHRSGCPKWFRKLYMGRRRKKDRWEEFLETVAAPVYNHVKNQATEKQMWKMMEQQGAKIGFFDQHHCYTKRQGISLNQQGQCSIRQKCSAFEDRGDGACTHQSVK